MRKLLLTMTALAALLMIAPSDGYAQYQSQVGLFADDTDLTSVTGTHSSGPATLYIVLMNPYLDNETPGQPGTEPVTAMGAFECRIELPASYFLANTTLPVQGLNIGESPNIIASYSVPVQVVDNQVTLATLTMFGTGEDDVMVYIVPNTQSPEFPGALAAAAIISLDPIEVDTFHMYVATNDFEEPCFIFNPTGGGPTPTEAASWGNVKALYR